MKRRLLASSMVAILMWASLSSGCGPQPVRGGTAGHLLSAGKPLAEVQVTIYHGSGSSFDPLGFGVTASDGSFQLLLNQARGPLKLAAGEYRCTLESAGAPVKIPKQFARPETTPLMISWQGGDSGLDLAVKEKLIP